MTGNPQAGKRKVPIDPADQELLRAFFAEEDTLENPTKLQQYVYCALSMTFGYRGHEIWRQLNKNNFRGNRNANGRPCLVIDQAVIKKIIQSNGEPNTTSRLMLYVTDDDEDGVFLYSTRSYICQSCTLNEWHSWPSLVCAPVFGPLCVSEIGVTGTTSSSLPGGIKRPVPAQDPSQLQKQRWDGT